MMPVPDHQTAPATETHSGRDRLRDAVARVSVWLRARPGDRATPETEDATEGKDPRSEDAHRLDLSGDVDAMADTGSDGSAESEHQEQSEHEELPRFLLVSARAEAPHGWLNRALEGLGLRRKTVNRPRSAYWEAQALNQRLLVVSAAAAVAVVAAFGYWLSNVGTYRPGMARNPQADAIADSFAEAPIQVPRVVGQSASTEAASPEAASARDANITTEEDPEILFEHRLGFVPSFAALYAGIERPLITAEAGPAGDAAQPVVEAVNSVAPVKTLGAIRIRNLPPDSKLSAGTRVSATEWLLTEGDLANLVVTLPGGRREPVKAEIALFGPDGAPSGTVAVAIERAGVGVKAASSGKDGTKPRARRKTVAKLEAKPVGKSVAKPVAKPEPAKQVPTVVASATPPESQAQSQTQAQIQPPTQPETTPAIEPVETAAVTPPPGPFASGTFPFLPGPFDPDAVPDGPAAATEILINLGVLPR